jgi:hypothetical protein
MDINKHTSRNMKELSRIQQHLTSALKVASNSLGEKPIATEVKSHIRSALRSIEKATKKEGQRSRMVDTPRDQWEGVVASVPYEPMSPETGQAVMKNLESLINAEKKSLQDMQEQKNKRHDDEFDMGDFGLLNG